MSLNTKFITCCKFFMFTHRVNSKFTTRQIYYHPVNQKVTKKTILTKRNFLSAIGFCETGFRLYFQTFVLSSNTKTGTRCNDQSRLPLIFTGSRLYHKYTTVLEEPPDDSKRNASLVSLYCKFIIVTRPA